MQDSPNKHGVMGSKSVGEPPLLLSASVMSAFQMAVAAAKEDLAHQHQGSPMENPQVRLRRLVVLLLLIPLFSFDM